MQKSNETALKVLQIYDNINMYKYAERVPFTIADFDREKGTVTIIVQIVGKTTKDLARIEAGEELLDFAGPLGMPTPLDGKKKVAVIGGGLGTAIAYPQAKKLHELGAEVTVITGFRNKELVILEEELKKVADKLKVGDRFVVNGVTSLQDGMEIKPVTEAQYAEKLKKTEQLGEAQGDIKKLKKAFGK